MTALFSIARSLNTPSAAKVIRTTILFFWSTEKQNPAILKSLATAWTAIVFAQPARPTPRIVVGR